MSGKEFTFGFKIAAAIGAEFYASFKNCNSEIINLNNNISKNKTIIQNLAIAQSSGTMSMEKAGAAAKKYSEELQSLINKQQALRKVDIAKSIGKTVAAYEVAAKSFGVVKSVFGVAKVAADFEESMAKVKAITQASDEDFAKLTKTARELGKTTKYSAMEAAESMSYLGMAGWKTSDIIKGMPGLLALAASSGQDLALCADIVSDQLSAFGMSADKASEMADILTVTSTGANTNVALMGETLKYVGATAGAAGYSFKDTALAMGIMANASTKGSMAGTALRSVMTRLVNPPKEAAAALAEINFNKLDDNGKLKTLTQQLEEMRAAAKKMSDAERLTFSKKVAGAEGSAGFASILTASDESWNKLKNDLSSAEGAANRTRAIMENNTKNAAKQFDSAVQEMQISIGNNLLPTLTELAQTGTSVANAIGSFSKAFPNFISFALHGTVVVSGLVMAVAAGNAIFNAAKTLYTAYTFVINTNTGALVLNTAKTILLTGAKIATTAAVRALTAALAVQNAAARILAGGINLVIGVVGLAKAAFIKLFAVMMANPWIALATIAVGAAVLIWQNWDTVKEWFTTLWDNPRLALEQFVNGVKSLLGDAWNWVKEKWESISGLLSKPIFGSVNITAKGDKQTSPASNATGGIYNRGAFLTTFAEDSGESAIPHTPNAHNIGLLAKTNEIMGNPLGVGNVNATFAPNITVQGGGDAAQLQQVLESEMERFKRMLQDLQNQQRRLSYA